MSSGVKLILGVWVAAILAGAGWVVWDLRTAGRAPGSTGIGGPFQLTDQDGKTVTEASLRGKPTVLYFGFTYCPDVCPTSLILLQGAIERLGKRAEGKVQAVLVTVDPERDTPQALKEFLDPYGPDFRGFTGTPEQIAAIAKAYRVYYQKVPGKDGAPYLMDHSSIFYVLDREGRFVQTLTSTVSLDTLARAIDRQL